jgi:hypothetical protein
VKLRIPLAVVVTALIMPSTAWAADDPTAGCPASKQLLSIDDTLARIDRRIYNDDEWAALVDIIEGVDANGDGYLCSKQYEPNRGQDKQWGAVDYVITQIGDNQPAGRTPD